MTELLTVSRASRLVGVTRTVLQQKIQSGELNTFDGKISMNQLTCLYPNACFEKNSFMMERVERIKAETIHRQEPLAAATVETLTTQLEKRTQQLQDMQEVLQCCQSFHQHLMFKVDTLTHLKEGELHEKIKELQTWLHSHTPKSEAVTTVVRHAA
jgi:CDP-4-dehydro-6-deoxyglucose reductase